MNRAQSTVRHYRRVCIRCLPCYTDNPEIAYPMFMKSAKADLVKGGKEWAGLIYIGGTHPASAGGAWIAAVKGASQE